MGEEVGKKKVNKIIIELREKKEQKRDRKTDRINIRPIIDTSAFNQHKRLLAT